MRDHGTSAADLATRHAALCAELERHNRLYYVENAPEITDLEFDASMRELDEIERLAPSLVTPESPTQRVGGAPLDAFESVEHAIAMLSIDNTYNPEALRAFDERVRKGVGSGEEPAYVVELKIDGVSISLRYERGRFVRAATRGDGVRGDDVSANVRTIPSVPLRLVGASPEVLEVRGEVYMRYAELERINRVREETGDPPLANPRNTTAGTLKLLDPREVAKRRLDVALYDIAEVSGADIASHWETLVRLRSYGFPVNPHAARCASIDEAAEVIERWRTRRQTLDYAMDGMVVKVDSAEHRRRLGATSKAPRWVIAYKYPAEVARTELRTITVQVGKSGTLTPVAELTPVPLAGTVVKRASLYNFDDLARKDLRAGDTVEIQKAGEIIPQVIRFVPEERPRGAEPFPIPTQCPVCGAGVHKDSDGVFLRCLNLSCPAQIKQRLEYFAGRSAMDIEGLGPAIVEQIVDRGLVRTPADLYGLRTNDLIPLERMGQRSASNLVAAIEKSKARPLSRLLNGLGIRHVGVHTAEVLAAHYRSIDALLAAPCEDLEEVFEIGAVVAASIRDFFDTEANRALIETLRAHGLTLHENVRATEGQARPFEGKVFVVTGTLAHYSRDAIHERIKELGGRPASNVSKATDYVVAGESAGSKLAKAQQLGVRIIDESEFDRLIQGGG